MLKCELHVETNLSQKENQQIPKRHRASCNDITVLIANVVSGQQWLFLQSEARPPGWALICGRRNARNVARFTALVPYSEANWSRETRSELCYAGSANSLHYDRRAHPLPVGGMLF